jgi:hypothetical protein
MFCCVASELSWKWEVRCEYICAGKLACMSWMHVCSRDWHTPCRWSTSKKMRRAVRTFPSILSLRYVHVSVVLNVCMHTYVCCRTFVHSCCVCGTRNSHVCASQRDCRLGERIGTSVHDSCIFMRLLMYINKSAYTRVHIYIHACMHAYMHIYHTFIHTYTYIHAETRISGQACHNRVIPI